jgi:hypothetical protein
MKAFLGSCVLCCLLIGCQKSPTKVEDVENHPLLQRPTVAEGSKSDPVVKPPTVDLNANKQPTPNKPLTFDEAVALASDPTLDYHARYPGVQAVHKMTPEKQIKVFRRIADAKVWEGAASAAAFLIKAGAADAAAVACRRLPDWSAHEQSIVVNAVSEATLRLDPASPALREVPRQALAHLLKEGIAPKERGDEVAQKTALVDGCAMILSRDAEPADKLLLQRAVQRYPQGTFLWLVLGRLQAITDKEAQIAKNTYQDDKLPISVRVAAATAVAGRDAEGAAITEKQIRGFLARYGNRSSDDELKTIGKQPSKEALAQFLNEHRSFVQELPVVTMLRFLETPAAEVLTFEAFQCKNPDIQLWGATVAACRWPEKFLNSGPGTLKPEDYANLLALVAAKHPNLRDKVLMKINEKELEAARARLRQHYSSFGGVTTDQLIFMFFSKSSAASGGAK